MKRARIATALVAASLCLASCAGSVETGALKGFAVTQAAFHGLQHSAIVAVQSGALTGPTKATVIQLVDRGQALETAGSTAASMGDLATLAEIQRQLATVTTQLTPLVPVTQGP